MIWIPIALVVGAVGWWLWERSRRVTHAVAPGLQSDVTLPHEREFELYHNALSLCSKKVRYCLAELGIEYASHPIDLIETGSYQNISRAFLKVNPSGVVPVLVHRGHPVYESHEAIRYAADHAPPGAPTLVPADPAQRAEMQEWVDRASLTGDDPTRAAALSAGNAVPGLTVPLFAAMIEEIPVRRIAEGLLFHRLKVRPLLFGVLKVFGIARLHRLKPAVAAIRSSIRHMNDHLDRLERQLEKHGGHWIGGDAFTLADVSWVVVFERLRETDSLDLFVGDGRRPRCAAYWERLRSRPSYAAAIAQHDHDTVRRGLARLRAAKRADPALRATLAGERSP